MKAILVKNNNFETVGFEVKHSGRTLFSWGISPELKSNFQKEVDVDDWLPSIIELIKIEALISEEGSFVNRWFEIATKQGFVEQDQGVNFKTSEERLVGLTQKMENIIKNII